ncbi:hypothetical protein [Polynucleobacter sp. UK-Mo-2m-Kol15]|uniref:hypothetical protein n=1 Tax=Polynucleobacter sp. UK-Mo-2m-Kol15 TaxID=2576916 RepID=UPI001C0C5FF1|nr:hypothetical protein [Polynucleobacter sp. UK-Mo-2m-Kol15]MBU3575758.1 hypothetical protein [Polynucleobacter sp. UK-Mo-2m-Kol15]
MIPFKLLSKIMLIFISAIYSSQFISAGSLSGNISIATSSLPSEISQQFSLKKISNNQDVSILPEEFRKLITSINDNDYYYAVSPTKGSGGYIFEVNRTQNVYEICLRTPKPMSAVTMAVTTPIALITVRKGEELNPMIVECK